MYKIPLSVPTSNGNELQYVKECIDTEWATSAGKNGTLFKGKNADYAGTFIGFNLLQTPTNFMNSE